MALRRSRTRSSLVGYPCVLLDKLPVCPMVITPNCTRVPCLLAQSQFLQCPFLNVSTGDVIAFDHNLKHAAFGGGRRRRMFTVQLASRYPDDNVTQVALAPGWSDRYGDLMLSTAPASRIPHLQQYYANDGAFDVRESARLAALLLRGRDGSLAPCKAD